MFVFSNKQICTDYKNTYVSEIFERIRKKIKSTERKKWDFSFFLMNLKNKYIVLELPEI